MRLVLACLLVAVVHAACPPNLSMDLKRSHRTPRTPPGFGPVNTDSGAPICVSPDKDSILRFYVADDKPIVSFALVWAGGAGFGGADCNATLPSNATGAPAHWGCAAIPGSPHPQNLFTTYIVDEFGSKFVFPALSTTSNGTTANDTFYDSQYPNSYQFVNSSNATAYSYITNNTVNSTTIILSPRNAEFIRGGQYFRLRSTAKGGCTCAYVYVKHNATCCENGGECMYGGRNYNWCRCRPPFKGRHCEGQDSMSYGRCGSVHGWDLNTIKSQSDCSKLGIKPGESFMGSAADNFREEDSSRRPLDILSYDSTTKSFNVTLEMPPYAEPVNKTLYCIPASRDENGQKMNYFRIYAWPHMIGFWIQSHDGNGGGNSSNSTNSTGTGAQQDGGGESEPVRFYLGLQTDEYTCYEPYFSLQYRYAQGYVSYFQPHCKNKTVGGLPMSLNGTTWTGDIIENYREPSKLIASFVLTGNYWTAQVVHNGVLYNGDASGNLTVGGDGVLSGRVDIDIHYPSLLSTSMSLVARFYCEFAGSGIGSRMTCAVDNPGGCRYPIAANTTQGQVWKAKQIANSTSTNPCQASPCMNGGTCSSTPYSPLTCSCLPGYRGTLCEQAQSPCSNLNEARDCPAELFRPNTTFLALEMTISPEGGEPRMLEEASYSIKTLQPEFGSIPLVELSTSFTKSVGRLYCQSIFYNQTSNETFFQVDFQFINGSNAGLRLRGNVYSFKKEQNLTVFSLIISPDPYSCQRPFVTHKDGSLAIVPATGQWLYAKESCPILISGSCSGSNFHGQWFGFDEENKPLSMWFFNDSMKVIVDNHTYTGDVVCASDNLRVSVLLTTTMKGFTVRFWMYSNTSHLAAYVSPPGVCINADPNVLPNPLTHVGPITKPKELGVLRFAKANCTTNNPCLNGGNCSFSSTEGIICACNSNWTGPTCAIPVVKCEVAPAIGNCRGLNLIGTEQWAAQLNSSNLNNSNINGLPWRFRFGSERQDSGVPGNVTIPAGSFSFVMYCQQVVPNVYFVDLKWNGSTNGLVNQNYAQGRTSYAFAVLNTNSNAPSDESVAMFINVNCQRPYVDQYNAVVPRSADTYIMKRVCRHISYPQQIHDEVVGVWTGQGNDGPVELKFTQDGKFEYRNLQPRPNEPNLFTGVTYMNSTNASGVIAANLLLESPKEMAGLVVRMLIDVNYSRNFPAYAPPGIIAIAIAEPYKCFAPTSINARHKDPSKNIDDLMMLVRAGNPFPGTCFDGVQNNGETGVDCGGPYCPHACPQYVNWFHDLFDRPDADLNQSNPNSMWHSFVEDAPAPDPTPLRIVGQQLCAFGKGLYGTLMTIPVYTNGVQVSKIVSLDVKYEGNATLIGVTAFDQNPMYQQGGYYGNRYVAGCIGDGREGTHTYYDAQKGLLNCTLVIADLNSNQMYRGENVTLHRNATYRLHVTFDYSKISVVFSHPNNKSQVGNFSQELYNYIDFSMFGVYMHTPWAESSSRTCIDNFRIQSRDRGACARVQTSCPQAWSETQWWGGEAPGANMSAMDQDKNGPPAKIRFGKLGQGVLPGSIDGSAFSTKFNATCENLWPNYYVMDMKVSPTDTLRAAVHEFTDDNSKEGLFMGINTIPSCITPYVYHTMGQTSPVFMPMDSVRVVAGQKTNILKLPSALCPMYLLGNYTGISSGDDNGGGISKFNLSVSAYGAGKPFRFNFTNARANGDVESFYGEIFCQANTTNNTKPILMSFNVLKPEAYAGFSILAFMNVNASYLPPNHADVALSESSLASITARPRWGPNRAENVTETWIMAKAPTALISCFDGIKNGNETKADCGGPCAPCLDTVLFFYDNFTNYTDGAAPPSSVYYNQFGGGDNPNGGVIRQQSIHSTNTSVVNILLQQVAAEQTSVRIAWRSMDNRNIFTGIGAMEISPTQAFSVPIQGAPPVFFAGCVALGSVCVPSMMPWSELDRIEGVLQNSSEVLRTTEEQLQYLQKHIHGIGYDKVSISFGSWYNLTAKFDQMTGSGKIIISQTNEQGQTHQLGRFERFDLFNYNFKYFGFYSNADVNHTTSVANFLVNAQSVPAGLSGCERKPCGSYGLCTDLGQGSFQCDCQPGYFGTLCNKKCNPGQYINKTGDNCAVCPPGRFSTQLSASVCDVCSPGQFQSKVGQTTCDTCAAGTYASASGQSVCLNCTLGKFSTIGAQACIDCPIGSVANSSSGTQTCSQCPEGKSNALGTVVFSTTNCSECPPGFHKPSTGACLACAAGTYSSANASTTCMSCAAGTYSGFASSTSCVACKPGSISTAGASSCTECEAGTYSSTSCPGSTAVCCVSCGVNMTSPAGSSSSASCERVRQAPSRCPTPEIVSKTDKTLVARLSPPSYNGGTEIVFYVGFLHDFAKNGTDYKFFFNAGDKTVGQLSPDSTYALACVAVNADNLESPISEWINVTTSKSAPAITGFVASDPDNGDSVWSAGDTATIVFDRATNTPSAATKTEIDALFTFSSPLGTDYTGVWTNTSALTITIVSVSGFPPVPGFTFIECKATGNIQALSGSAASVAVAVLTGNWGTNVQVRLLSSPLQGTPKFMLENEATNITDLITPEFSNTITSMALVITVQATEPTSSKAFLTISGGSATTTVTTYLSAVNASAVLATIQCKPTQYFNGKATINFAATSNTNAQQSLQASVRVFPVNNPPSITAPTTTVSVPINQLHTLTGISVSDPDVSNGGTDSIGVGMIVFTGQLQFSGAAVSGVKYSPAFGRASSSQFLQGTVAAVNSALSALQVKFEHGYSHTQPLYIYASDNANGGYPTLTAQSQVNLSVTCQNAPAPTVTSAVLGSKLNKLVISFNTNIDVCLGKFFFNCSSMFHADSLLKFGDGAVCAWTGANNFTVLFGQYGGNYTPLNPRNSDSVILLGDVLPACCGGTNKLAATTVAVTTTTIEAPRAAVFGPRSFAAGCDGMNMLLFGVADNTGPFGVSASGTWELDSKISTAVANTINKNGFTLNIPSSAMQSTGQSTSYTFTFTVTNYLNVKSAAVTHTVEAKSAQAPTLISLGPTTISMKRQNALVMYVFANFSSCFSDTNKRMSFTWSSSVTFDVNQFNISAETNPTFYLRPNMLSAGSHTFTVTGCMLSNVCSSLAFTVNVAASPPVVVLASGSSARFSANYPFTLSAAGSFDPDTGSQAGLTFAWGCVSSAGSTCTNAQSAQAMTFSAANSITVSNGTLSVGVYVFTCTVTKGSIGVSRSTTVQIIAGVAPLIKIDAYGITNGYVPTNGKVLLVATATAVSGSLSNVQYQWQITSGTSTAILQQATLTDRVLQLNPNYARNAWNSGESYTITVTVSATGVSSGESSQKFTIATKPNGCGLSFSPSSISAFETVTISAKGCTADGSSTFTYEFYYYDQFGKQSVSDPSQQDSFKTENLPAGDSSNSNKLIVGVSVTTANGLETSDFNSTLVVNPVSTSSFTDLFTSKASKQNETKNWKNMLGAIAAVQNSAKASGLSGTDAATLTDVLIDAVATVVSNGASAQNDDVVNKLASLTSDTTTLSTKASTAVINSLKSMYNRGDLSFENPQKALKFLDNAVKTITNLLQAILAPASVNDGAKLMGVDAPVHAPIIWRDMAYGDATHKSSTNDIYTNLRSSTTTASNSLLTGEGDTQTWNTNGMYVHMIRQRASTGHSLTLSPGSTQATITVPAAALSGQVAGATLVDVTGAHAPTNSYVAWPPTGTSASALTSPSVKVDIDDVSTPSSPAPITANAGQVQIAMKVNCVSSGGCKNIQCYKWDTASGAFVSTGVTTDTVADTSGAVNNIDVTCRPTASGVYAVFAESAATDSGSSSSGGGGGITYGAAGAGVVVIGVVLFLIYRRKKRKASKAVEEMRSRQGNNHKITPHQSQPQQVQMTPQAPPQYAQPPASNYISPAQPEQQYAGELRYIPGSIPQAHAVYAAQGQMPPPVYGSPAPAYNASTQPAHNQPPVVQGMPVQGFSRPPQQGLPPQMQPAQAYIHHTAPVNDDVEGH